MTRMTTHFDYATWTEYETELHSVWCDECHGRIEFIIEMGQCRQGISGAHVMIDHDGCTCGPLTYEIQGALIAACLDGYPKDVEDFGFLSKDPGPKEDPEAWGPLPYSAPPGYDYSVGYHLCPEPTTQMAHNRKGASDEEPR